MTYTPGRKQRQKQDMCIFIVSQEVMMRHVLEPLYCLLGRRYAPKTLVNLVMSHHRALTSSHICIIADAITSSSTKFRESSILTQEENAGWVFDTVGTQVGDKPAAALGIMRATADDNARKALIRLLLFIGSGVPSTRIVVFLPEVFVNAYRKYKDLCSQTGFKEDQEFNNLVQSYNDCLRGL